VTSEAPLRKRFVDINRLGRPARAVAVTAVI
jgi:hypothetical protein